MSASITLAELSDNQLVEHIKRNSKRHFRVLVERHLHKMWRVAFGVLQDGHEAEDVVQEVFVTVWNKRNEIDESKAAFTTWAYRITLNRAIDVKRKRKAPTSDIMDTPVADAAPLADEIHARSQTGLALAHMMQDLPEKQREALEKFYYEESSIRDISQAMNASEDATRSLLKRGRQSLKAIMVRQDNRAQLQAMH